MPIPRTVEQQAKDAEERIKKFAEGRNTEQAPQEGDQPQDTLPANDQTPPEPPEAPAKPPQPEDDFEQKYRVLRGKYDSEVPALQRQVNLLSQENAAIKRQLEDALKAQESKAQNDGSQAPPAKTELDPEDYREFGDEMVLLVQNLNEQAKTIRQYEDKFGKLEQDERKAAEAAAADSFQGEIARLCPDYQTLNTSKEFLAWMNQPDEFFGTDSRWQRFDAAVQAQDAITVAAYFNQYLREVGNGSSAPQQAAPQPEQPKPSITPDRSASNASPNPQDDGKRTWTRQQIKELGDDYAKGRYRGREDEYQRQVEDMHLAIAEGRVVG